ncbi:UDP-N-acetylglucosamine-N-acetylmuramylpentapeptide N-acetylglucosamine transferase [Clostridium cadaveris]|uniref:UDP-N-acetylglucosamine--N-acetylmuramyl-(pentapeptide) pyrophosphoryl-undecaprenol N-acetylglucosamine transferase n=1 Tax=Clostridium cadaveris TaxID=1529 RepID=A0A1I2JIV4_9CLOT|nr:undecaprenyldiphospho-muramoylpentapeptide beta-N-acetylglucosaminyltransferase [Clostridium cadaveris]MDM8313119.1 undecaprenyldiphospho-muramoylpentapeptide beta-N-acetylglucosaminyltransferase [Clostridium cadaveris]SFF53900.1 UDP-N-acetylglucosamine-N-acetylmuramylpentapeptide N-acetylglucosamine transferase [Clostridium cadaveris]
MSKYKIIMTGGGSAGHVTPNLALVPTLRTLDYDIKYIGSKDGIEKEIINKEGIPYYEISSGKLRRYFDLKNFTDPFKVIIGIKDAYSVLKKEKPNIVFSKGGFVTVPVVIAAKLRGIPIVCHESDMTPGLANRLTIPYTTKLCVTFPESLKHVKGGKGVLTGTPIRKELLKGSREKGRRFLNFDDMKPVMMVIGGSLGSKAINGTIRESLNEITNKYNVVHICGNGNLDESLKDVKGYKQFEFIREELPDVMAVADIVVSRAGANSIFELLALKKPNLLIPLSRNSSRGDQILNAASFEKSGYSMVIQEEDLKKESLLKALDELNKNRVKYIKNMDNSTIGNGVDAIISVIRDNTKK